MPQLLDAAVARAQPGSGPQLTYKSPPWLNG
jgi:hypothetical protein